MFKAMMMFASKIASLCNSITIEESEEIRELPSEDVLLLKSVEKTGSDDGIVH